LDLKVQCCFCGEGIGDGAPSSPLLDPCAVLLVGNWRAAESEQLSQQFFCHLACFRGKMLDPSNLALDDIDPEMQA
jgi:hypothetical protein